MSIASFTYFIFFSKLLRALCG